MNLLERVRVRGYRKFLRWLQWPRVVFYRCLSTARVSGKPARNQPLQAAGRGRVSFGENVAIGVPSSPYFFSTVAYLEARHPSAEISIGSGTWINNNFCAMAEYSRIEIGKNCLIGTNVEIIDSDFHGLAVEDRRRSSPAWARPVTIGDEVFVGSNVIILKGVTVGSGSVLANGAVVARDVPARVVVAGNPARIIKAL